MEFTGGLNQAMQGTSAGAGGNYMVAMPTMKQRLEQAVVEAESRLADAKRARDILNANPDLEELLNIMQRGRF